MSDRFRVGNKTLQTESIMEKQIVAFLKLIFQHVGCVINNQYILFILPKSVRFHCLNVCVIL